MFCNTCGKEVQTGQTFCGSCGTPVTRPSTPTPPPVTAATGRVARHVRTLAVLWIALSALNLLRGGGRLIGAHVVGMMGRGWFEDNGWGFPGWPIGAILPGLLSIMGLISLVLAVIGFVVGFGLMERRPWARTLAIVVGIVALLHPILATALGIYTLWVLIPSQSETEYVKMAAAR